MNLVLDIGNTRTKAAVFNSVDMVENIAFTGSPVVYLEKLFDRFPGIVNAIISSVKEPDEELIKFISRKIKGRLMELTETTPVPVKNLYQSPETLGKDRLAAVVGAYILYQYTNILVIDAGTAITFDFVNAEGEYLGGNISPGMEMRFNALNLFTGKLPKYSGTEVFPDMGYSTETAIISGVIKGIVFEIEGYIASHKEKYADLTIIITGGDAEFFVKKLKKTIFVIPNLILTGLNNILQYNEKLH